MRETSFSLIDPEKLKRLTFIEGREDLFETKVLHIKPEKSEEENHEQKHIVAVSRDPGSASALVPVIALLHKNPEMTLDAIVDGRAQEIFQKSFISTDITPQNALAIDTTIGTPDMFLMDPSISEKGLDDYIFSTYPEVPKVLIMDSPMSLYILKQLEERGLSFPDKICAIDEDMKKTIVQKYPTLKDRVEVTGQPSFDSLALENTEEISQKIKQELGLPADAIVVTFMATNVPKEYVAALAKELGSIKNIYVVHRKHPRDNTSPNEYQRIFENAGVQLVDTNSYPTSDIGAASDIIITTWSIEGLHAIYRKKKTIHLVDTEFINIPPNVDFPLPHVKLGASVGLTHMSELSGCINELLDDTSSLSTKVTENMARFYNADGKNTERVAQVIYSMVNKKQKK